MTTRFFLCATSSARLLLGVMESHFKCLSRGWQNWSLSFGHLIDFFSAKRNPILQKKNLFAFLVINPKPENVAKVLAHPAMWTCMIGSDKKNILVTPLWISTPKKLEYNHSSPLSPYHLPQKDGAHAARGGPSICCLSPRHGGKDGRRADTAQCRGRFCPPSGAFINPLPSPVSFCQKKIPTHRFQRSVPIPF